MLAAMDRFPFRSRRLARGKATLLAALSLLGGCGGSDATPPRVFVLLVDTLRADALGCYGREGARTPRIDAFAAEAVRFEQAISSSGWTLPSAATLLTGSWPELHKATGKRTRLTPITPDLPLISELLNDDGFATVAVANAAFLSPPLGVARGFDAFDHRLAFNWNARRADESVDTALGLIAERSEEPLFALVHLFDPHLDYDPPPGYREPFVGGRADPPPPVSMQEAKALAQAGGGRPSEGDIAYVRGLYQGEVAFVDTQIGRFFDALRELGMYEEATIVLVADHGEEFWDHGGFEHGHTLYDELIRVPLLIKPPASAGIAPGVVPQQVRTVDIAPTIFDLLGRAPAPTFEGTSLLPLMRGEREEQPRVAFSQATLYGSDKLSWRTDRWHLVIDRDPKAANPRELYDRIADPEARHDLAAARPLLLQRLEGELFGFFGDLHDRSRSLRTPRLRDMSPAAVQRYEKSLESLGYTGREEE